MTDRTTSPDESQLLTQLSRLLESSPEISIVGHDGVGEVTLTLPPTLRALVTEALSLLDISDPSGTGPNRKPLTTQQAADALGVSRPTVISLLDEFEIPFSLVGRHRRLDPQQVTVLRSRLRDKRRQQLRAMRELAQDIGEYDANPADNPLVRKR